MFKNPLADISVIIVNYNVKELLENCINSILAASKNLAVEIVIVDNNSFDGSVDYINSKFSSYPNIKVIPGKINLGFAKANNLGVKASTGNFILILNPDTVLQEDTLDKSLEFYKGQPDAGAISCKLILPNGKLDLACRRSFPTPKVAVYRILGLSKLFPKSRIFGKYNLTYLDENKTYEVDAIVGAFIFIRKEIYEKVNGFDEDYFMYGEDLDLCYRIKKAGYKIFYYPETSIIHYKGESTKKSSLSYINNFYGAMQIFVKKNLNTTFVLMNILIKISIFYRAVISYLKRFIINFYPAIFDLALIVTGMLIAIRQRFEDFPVESYQIVIFIYSGVWLLSLAMSGTYNRNNIHSLVRPVNGILIGFFINSSITYFFNEYAFSRVVVLRATANAIVFIILWRIAVKIINFSKKQNIFYSEGKTLIVGKNEESEKFVTKLNKRVDSEYDLLGYIATSEINYNGFVGNLNNINDIIVSYNVKNILFAKNALTNQQILDLMWNLRKYNINFKILSEDNDILLGKSALDKIDEIYLMQIEYNINKKINIFTKRLFDIFFGVLCLVSVYPVAFLVLKLNAFRSDRNRFVKKLMLIPSVILGKLSFVGRATWDTSEYGKEYLGKNGLTGLPQINFYKHLTTDEIEYYNYYYAKNQSLTLDIEIILKTISLFLFRKNIPEI